jgi:hypothetical protein
MATLASHLLHLEELVLLFNNPGQQLESRHLAALAPLRRLRRLTLQANFHPEACSFGAALGGLSSLQALVVLPSEASAGLTDGHVASMAGLRALRELEFPGHARAFTGATLGSLATPTSRLSRLVVASNKPGAVDYTLTLPALAGLRAITRRRGAAAAAAATATAAAAAAAAGAGAGAGGSSNTTASGGGGGGSQQAVELQLGVPDAAFAAALLRAVAGPGLASLAVTVREAADAGSIAALAAVPGAAQQLCGLDLEFRAAPSAADVAALASCAALRRLHVSCKCPRPPAAVLDWTPWLGLRQLEHVHLHINPAWRPALQPGAVAAMAAAWPQLKHLHLRLSPSDNATHALTQLRVFTRLESLSLTWLGQAAGGPAAGGGGGGGGGCARARRGGSLEAASFNLAYLPRGLRELSLTSISTVRLGLPPAPPQQPLDSASSCSSAAPPAAAAGAAQDTAAAASSSSSSGGGAPVAVLPRLRSLVLDGNFGVSDELLAALLGHAPRLSALSLVLAGRQTLTSDGLQAALAAAAAAAAAATGGAGAAGLQALSVSDYREAPLCLSQASLAGLAAAGLGKLRHLKLSTPDVVHAELLPAVFAGFTKLRRLDLVGCQEQAAAALGGVLPLCCIKPGPEWAGDAAAVAAAAAAAAAAVALPAPPVGPAEVQVLA